MVWRLMIMGMAWIHLSEIGATHLSSPFIPFVISVLSLLLFYVNSILYRRNACLINASIIIRFLYLQYISYMLDDCDYANS